MRIGKNNKPLAMNKAKKKSTKNTRHSGQPTKYDNKYDSIAEQACAIGTTIHQLAKMFNVTQPTINNWMRDNETFFLSVKAGRDRFDTEYVENALLKRARGYKYTREVERVSKGGVYKCSEEMHVVPDVGAAIFWLCNRQPQRWKQISQAKFQQLNMYQGNAPSKGNGKEKPVDGEIGANDVREILNALHESGAMDSGLGLPESSTAKGTDTKAH